MPREQYHASLNKKQKRRLNEISSTFFYGADKGSRTLLSGLGSRRSTANTQYRYQIALNGTHFPLKSRCKVKYYIFLTMCYVRIIIIKHFGV